MIGWPFVSLDQVANRGSGHTPAKKHLEYWGGSVKWLSLKDTFQLDRGIVETTAATITDAGLAHSSAVMHPAGTVILLRDAGIGKSAVLGSAMAVSQHFMAWTCGARLDNWFLYYLFQARKSEFERISNGSTIKTIGIDYFRQLHIPLPPITEQKRISRALRDCDELITSFELLIAKKEAVRQGLMQQLLTGRTRLPGFTEPWSEVLLGDHVNYVRTVALPRAQLDLTSWLKCLHYGDIHSRYSIFLDTVSEKMPHASPKLAARAGRLECGDLVFADASEDRAGVGRCVEIVKTPSAGVVSGLHTIAARFDKAILADGFKAYLQFVPSFRDQLLRFAAGTKVLATTRSQISRIGLPLPSVVEQDAIAEVLLASGREIEALCDRLEKAHDVKTGVMQQLLTGRIRIPAEAAS